jgi:predicted nucleic acid-binding protein
MIAAVAVADGAALATRNATDFAGLETMLNVIQL